MSGTLPKSSDKYEENITSRGQVSTVTDNIDDTQHTNNIVPEMSNEQSSSHNLANLEVEDGDRTITDQLPPHVIIETVSYEDYVKQKDGQIVEEREGGDNIEVIELDDDDEEVNREQASGSTSTGNRKRKSSSTPRSGNNKRQKSVTTDGSNKHQCKSPGCGKSFRSDYDLSRHELIHLNIKPFLCTWPNCGYSAVRKSNVVLHVRIKHFKLPALQKEQQRLNIVDNRNPEDYVRVDNQLLERRLE